MNVSQKHSKVAAKYYKELGSHKTVLSDISRFPASRLKLISFNLDDYEINKTAEWQKMGKIFFNFSLSTHHEQYFSVIYPIFLVI